MSTAASRRAHAWALYCRQTWRDIPGHIIDRVAAKCPDVYRCREMAVREWNRERDAQRIRDMQRDGSAFDGVKRGGGW